MKRFIFTFLTLILFLNTGCFKQDVRKLTVSTPQMENSECATIITNALRIKGISNVDFDLDTKTVVVTYDSLFISSKNIETVISKSGFDANSILANPLSRSKLPAKLKESKRENPQNDK